jgi:hypothetical protein
MKTTLCLAVAVAALAVNAAHAVPILATGFEAPEYLPGDLVGQNGWDAVGLFPDDLVTVNVQSSVVRSGSQAVSLSGSGEGAGAFAYKLTPHIPTPNTRIVVDFDMQWGTSGTTKSYLYGVQTYDTDLNLVGSIGVANVFGVYNAVVFDDEGTPLAIPGAIVTPGQWHHFQLVLDYDNQSYQGVMDGIASPIIPFQTLGVQNYGEADLFRDAGLGNANDTAYFDNLNIMESVVPEPASLAGLIGLSAVAGRRRS